MSQSSLALALAGISFMLTVIWGTPLLRVLRHLKIGKAIRVEGPQRHITKTGTPTMGGLMIILPVLLITVLMNATPLLGFKRTGPVGAAAAGRAGALCHFGSHRRLAGVARAQG